MIIKNNIASFNVKLEGNLNDPLVKKKVIKHTFPMKINSVKKPLLIQKVDFTEYLPKNKKESKKMKKLATFLWATSASLFARSTAFAADGGSHTIWESMQPLWSVFQDIAMTVGGIALFIGIILFLFKRNVGKKVVMTAVLVVGGCFLVPAALMLVAIVGHLLNDALTTAFTNMNLENSVKVGK